MTRMWVVLGDPTSSGGQVISGSPFTDIDGDPTTIIDGEAVALHGSSLACGCKVLAVKQMRGFVDAGIGAVFTTFDMLPTYEQTLSAFLDVSDSDSQSSSTRVAGLTLSRLSGYRTEAVWELDFTDAPGPFVLSPGECLRPGESHGEGAVESLLAKPVPGEHYTLSIMGAVHANGPDGDGWATRLYRENFCLKPRALGETSVVSVPWGAGRPQWEMCTE